MTWEPIRIHQQVMTSSTTNHSQARYGSINQLSTTTPNMYITKMHNNRLHHVKECLCKFSQPLIHVHIFWHTKSLLEDDHIPGIPEFGYIPTFTPTKRGVVPHVSSKTYNLDPLVMHRCILVCWLGWVNDSWFADVDGFFRIRPHVHTNVEHQMTITNHQRTGLLHDHQPAAPTLDFHKSMPLVTGKHLLFIRGIPTQDE